jgi:hypothetical protein
MDLLSNENFPRRYRRGVPGKLFPPSGNELFSWSPGKTAATNALDDSLDRAAQGGKVPVQK